jgi:hypothetical protein
MKYGFTWWLMLAVLSSFSVSCAFMGKITNPKADVSAFVHEKQPLFIATHAGEIRINTDGTDRELLFGPRYRLRDYSPDGRFFVLGDVSDHYNLYVMDYKDKIIRQVPELNERVENLSVSPDGNVVAVSRFCDFSMPEDKWNETYDDGIYLVDLRTLKVKMIQKTGNRKVYRIVWSKDGNTLWLIKGMDVPKPGDLSAARQSEKIDIKTGERISAGAWPQELKESMDVPCEKDVGHLVLRPHWERTAGTEGIDIKDASGKIRRLIVIEGYYDQRFFGDPPLRNINTFFYTKSCHYVVFELHGKIWVSDVENGTVGFLTEGVDPKLAP